MLSLTGNASIETFGGAANGHGHRPDRDRISLRIVAVLNRWLNSYRPGRALATWLPTDTAPAHVQALLAVLAVTTAPQQAEDLVHWVVKDLERELKPA